MPLFLLVLACGGSASIPEQLSTGGAVLTQGLELEEEYEDVAFSGALSVQGEGSDFTATLTTGDGDTFAFDVHSPTEAPLGQLDGAEVSVSMPIFGFEETRSLILLEGADPVYVLDAGYSADDVNALFGAEVVSFGAEQATDRDSTWDWSYTTLRLSTDDGDVELLPGEVVEVTIDGARWRAAAIAAYDREVRPNGALPGCPVLHDVLSYELLRVEEAVTEDFLTRPLDQDPAALGCH
ncbi:MAG: hypothetical protein H6740_22860 [Alphaproteobacteria bacterium]|nr:hypothetical protein [Alphaproteobacteria bacterium]